MKVFAYSKEIVVYMCILWSAINLAKKERESM